MHEIKEILSAFYEVHKLMYGPPARMEAAVLPSALSALPGGDNVRAYTAISDKEDLTSLTSLTVTENFRNNEARFFLSSHGKSWLLPLKGSLSSQK